MFYHGVDRGNPRLVLGRQEQHSLNEQVNQRHNTEDGLGSNTGFDSASAREESRTLYTTLVAKSRNPERNAAAGSNVVGGDAGRGRQTGREGDQIQANDLHGQASSASKPSRDATNAPGSSHDDAESSSTTGKSAKKGSSRNCTACYSELFASDAVRYPCAHDYCRACTTALFKTSINDGFSFPPRCCNTPIPLKLVQTLLPKTLVSAYRRKELEHSTSSKTYCHVPSCSEFIPFNGVQDTTATCTQCQSETCIICKENVHEGDCSSDAAALQLLELAKKNGWQRCYSCQNVVELHSGCNHISCRCSAQFCYACGLQWKNCRCEHWVDARTPGPRYALMDRDAGAQGSMRARNEQHLFRLERDRHYFPERATCVHRSWRNAHNAAPCGLCRCLPGIIYECQDCHTMACRRCRLTSL